MPGWSNSEPDESGDSLGARVVRMLGHGLFLTGLGIAVGAAFGVSSSFGFGSAAFTWTVSVGCGYVADAMQNAAIEGRKRLREEIAEDIERENAAVREAERTMPIVYAAQAQTRECTRPFVALLERQRNRETESGKGF
jgi:hypothetical protein